MIVDDSREALHLLTRSLYNSGFDVRPVANGQGAINAVLRKLPDLILLEINIPETNGYEVCRWLKVNSETENIPIIFVSTLDDVRNKVKAFEVGAVDYIVKPFNYPEVQARIETHLRNSQKLRSLIASDDRVTHRYDRFANSEEDTGAADPTRPTPQTADDSESTKEPHGHSDIISSAFLKRHHTHRTIEQISHSLRNPIHIVTLTFNLLRKRIASTDPKVTDYFERIERNLNEISQIIAETAKQ